MQCIIPVKVFNFADRIENIYRIDIFLYNLRLIAMLLVAGLSLIIKLPQVILFKNYLHITTYFDCKNNTFFEKFALFANFFLKIFSAMLTGNPYFKIHPYEREEEINEVLDEILK